MKLISFRMDDLTPDMRWERFYAFKRLLDAFRIEPLIGIVPENRDASLRLEPPVEDFWDRMRGLAAGGWLVAQHGYQHLTATTDPGILQANRQSEFSGLPEQVQLEKIAAGRAILAREGLATDIWMAPAHSYDHATLRALRATGFRTISDGLTFFPYDEAGLRFIPCQMGRPRYVPLGVITIYIHSNFSSDSFIEELRGYIQANRAHIVNFRKLLEIPPRNRLNRHSEKAFVALRKAARVIRNFSIR